MIKEQIARTEEELNKPNPYWHTKIDVPLTAIDIKLISDYIHEHLAGHTDRDEVEIALYHIADDLDEIYSHSKYCEEQRIRLESRKALRKQREGESE